MMLKLKSKDTEQAEQDALLEKEKPRLEYKDFKTRFFKIELAGFKGEASITQIQEKSTNVIYQLIEKDIKIPSFESEMEKYEKYSTLDHPNILKLNYYTSVFREENHGDPFCRVSLLLENAETDLYKYMQDYKKNKVYLSDDHMLAIILYSIEAFAYLQENGVSHGSITLKHFFITKNNDFKVLPNYFNRKRAGGVVKSYKKGTAKDLYYSSPEAYKLENSKTPFERFTVNPYKSDVFTLGMNLMEVATLEDCSKCYNLYVLNESMVQEVLAKVKERYSGLVYTLISRMLVVNSDLREDFLALHETILNIDLPDIAVNLILKVDDNPDLKMLNNPDYLPQDFVNEIEAKIQSRIQKVSNRMQEKYVSKGNLYLGECNSKGEPHGSGTVWWATGDRYEGRFENGVYSGEGMYYFSNGMKHYGYFKNGEIDGLGVRYYVEKGIYFGEWKNGKNHGKGMFIWPNGEKYLGVFKEDEIEGLGVLTWLSGRKIEGIWTDQGPGIGLAQSPEYDITMPALPNEGTDKPEV